MCPSDATKAHAGNLAPARADGDGAGEVGMRVLVACEFSGVVRDAFTAAGHDAMSCDLLPTEAPGPHYQGDVRDILRNGWDLMVAHPPCTYLTQSGVRWLYAEPLRWKHLIDGAATDPEQLGLFEEIA